MLSRRPSTPKRRRNSLVLPEVPMPDDADDAADFPPRPHHRSTLESPPPTEGRSVRFSLPPPPIERRRTDEEPAWPDFMVRFHRSSSEASTKLTPLALVIRDNSVRPPNEFPPRTPRHLVCNHRSNTFLTHENSTERRNSHYLTTNHM